MISIDTPKGRFRVWTKRVGDNPRIKVLLLHGGPGLTHECFEAFEPGFAAAGIEYYLYDQLGSGFSDRPDAPELWDLPRFVDEVEQVRRALGIERETFYLLGHSWGGILAIEYALHHQQHLKGLIISNMMASSAAYNDYADRVLIPGLAQAEDERNPERLIARYYTQYMLRLPRDQWPDAVSRTFDHINPQVASVLLGESEFHIGGKLATWDRLADLPRITVPTLVIGARHDTMDPTHMQMMASRVQKGRYLFCPSGSHFAMYDDRKAYIDGVIQFLRDVDAGNL